MTDFLPWLAANLQFLGIVISVALAFLILFIAGGVWAIGWYMRRLIDKAFGDDSDPWTDEALMGNVPHVPEKAKRRAA